MKISNEYVFFNSRITGQQPPLLTVTVQYPVRPDMQNHPPILLFNLQEIRICVDPLLCRWLLYSPKRLLDTKIDITGEIVFVLIEPYVGKYIYIDNLLYCERKQGGLQIVPKSFNQ